MPTQDSRTPTLDQIPNAARDALASFLQDRSGQISAIGGPVSEAVSHLESFVLGGGKRIRPLYAWAGFVGGGGLERGVEDPQAVLRAAASLEFIQGCALIHDDIIDASDTRRGNPTVHRAVETTHSARKWAGESAHFGESVAILVGDLALVWAEDMFLDSGLTVEALRRVRDPWRAMRTEVIGGQLLDIFLEATGDEDIESADSVNRYKTAAYTIERPLHLGAAIAGADSATIDAFRGYGRDIGIAFQLRDDQLGVYGDPAVTGKPAGDDLREGKRTVLLATALQLADERDPAAAAELRAKIGVTSDPQELSRLADIINSTGAVDIIEERITALTNSGLAFLDAAGTSTEVTATLKDLAIRSTTRRS